MGPDKKIRVLLADDQNIVRKGTHALLDTIEDVAVVGEAANGNEAVALATALEPDVVLMDLVMPACDGVEATRQVTTAHPGIHVIVMTSFGSDDKLLAAVRAGAVGYLLKDADPEALTQAIRQVARGGAWLPPDLTRRVLNEFSHPEPAKALTDPLTDRELQVLRLLAQGRTNAQMAEAMYVSEVTIRTHVSHIHDKLGVENRVQAALYALRTGIATL
jgi:two-component system, NarL family, response regulator LiaR